MLLLDSGNFSDNPTTAGDAQTQVLVEGMTRLGYAAANVGERDLATGYEEFVRKTVGAGFPFVSTNIVRQDTAEPVFKPFVILEAKGGNGKPIRVGVMGVVRFNPLFLKAGPAGSSLVVARPDEMVRRYIEKVRSSSDVVVLLAGLSKDDSRRIAQDIPGIDFVLGAYGGIYTTQDETEGNTVLVYTGNQGKRVGESRIVLGPAGRMSSQTSYMYFLTSRYPDDAEMLAWVSASAAKRGLAKQAAAAAGAAGARPPNAGAPVRP